MRKKYIVKICPHEIGNHYGNIPKEEESRIREIARDYDIDEFKEFSNDYGYNEWMESYADVPYDELGFTEDVCNSIDRDLREIFYSAHEEEYDVKYRYCGF